MDEKIEFGVWGGMTERERRVMLKRRPDVICWESFLVNASAGRETNREAAAPEPMAQPIPISARRPAAATTSASTPIREAA